MGDHDSYSDWCSEGRIDARSSSAGRERLSLRPLVDAGSHCLQRGVELRSCGGSCPAS
jgi:hypothetical protein